MRGTKKDSRFSPPLLPKFLNPQDKDWERKSESLGSDKTAGRQLRMGILNDISDRLT